MDFTDSKFSECPDEKYNNQIHDFVSQVEMELCLESTIFVESHGSSWSLGVNYDRHVRGRRGNDVHNDVFL